MKRGKKPILIGIGVLVVLVLAGAGWYLSRAMPIGTGYVARYICSSVFISHRDPQITYREDVSPINPLAGIIDFKIDHAQKKVVAGSFGLFKSTALYREGCGCTLVTGTSEEALRKQQLTSPDPTAPLPRDPNAPWPIGDGGASEQGSGEVNTEKLKAALDAAFIESNPEKKKMTRAVLIVYDGKLIGERYAPDFDKSTSLLGWSMSKSVTNALVGILVRQGRFRIQDPAPVPEWQREGDPRKKITLDQLLRMSSGLKFDETYEPLHDVTDMLYLNYDFAAYAAAKPLETDPDAKWVYSSGTANIIARMARHTAEKDYPRYYDFLRKELFSKVGMHSAVPEPDASGTFVGSSYMFATPRDWARFGLLYLQDGVWEGERILPEGWVKYSATPTPKAPQGQYGALFWLNAGTESNPKDRVWPNAPTDAFAARGYQEQYVVIIPSKKLVIVRFGATSVRAAWDMNDFISLVTAAIADK
ncbi:MAG: serine hydrolase [Deltaproteobacteria bacterium]|nr:serine hydrolase [Deltaproteobacteria bacterium]